MINEEKLDSVLLELGHDDFNRGTAYLRQAVKMWDHNPEQALTKELYPALAKLRNGTAAGVERSMRGCIEKAWSRGNPEAQLKWFGWSVSQDKGKPTVGEYVSRLARICREGIV